jgi:predicted double-glycine peptidase
MDFDVIATTLGVMGLAILASVLGYRFSFTMTPVQRVAMLGVTMVCVSLYASLVVGRLEIAHYFPSAIAIFATNITPILVAFAAGIAWTMPTPNFRRRQVRFFCMAILSIVFYFAPVIRPIIKPVISDEVARFQDGVCMQSHSASCGAAAAATLLLQHGIAVSEQEMIRACFTSSDGTEPLALYRGLKSQTRFRDLTPRLTSRQTEQWDSLNQYPCVAFVSFRDDDEASAVSMRRILGRGADGHAIVIFGRTANGKFLIGDPAVGRTIWDKELFNRRFSGQAIYLAPIVRRSFDNEEWGR